MLAGILLLRKDDYICLFVYLHPYLMCMRAVSVQSRLYQYTASPEPSQLAVTVFVLDGSSSCKTYVSDVMSSANMISNMIQKT